jgi:hypothetical protein
MILVVGKIKSGILEGMVIEERTEKGYFLKSSLLTFVA